MVKEKFKKEFIIGPQMVDEADRLTFDILLGLMTEAHTSYAELYGMPIEELMERGYTYVIQKEELFLERPIYIGEKLVIYPFIEGISKNSIIRGALIKDKDEAYIGGYTAIVKVIDKNSREKVHIPGFIYKAYGICKVLDNELSFGRIPGIKSTGYIEAFSVSMSDLDINDHVTHSRYLKWALEKIPKEFLSLRSLKKVSIVFLKELFYGESVILRYKITENDIWKDTVTIHQIENSRGDSAAMIQCTWNMKDLNR